MHTDDELYHLFLSGDTTSYDELMIRHGDSLTVYLNGYLHDWQDSEDLMIEAFARIMVKRPRMSEGKFKAYLFKTARNLHVFALPTPKPTLRKLLPHSRIDVHCVGL